MGKILLYYKYVSIPKPSGIREWQHKICTDLGLRGRIIIAQEGINGTVGGDDQSIDRYLAIMRQHELFKDIDFKESFGGANCFNNLQIRVKPEVVHLGLDPLEITAEQGGTHLNPDQVHELIANKPSDLVILDARNTIESRIGKFVDAVTPEITNFRELPTYIDTNLDQFKDKQVLMYCTGGIRCERATAYLKSKGVAKEVFQIEGGIVRYTEKYPDGFFRGKNYVFDNRVAMPINSDILSLCSICPASCDEYTNCINARCNKHFIACPSCITQFNNTCGQQCHDLVASNSVPRRPVFEKKSPSPSACAV